jgi:hypothetical protein
MSASYVASDHAHAFQRNIERALSATYALGALVRQGNGEVHDFDAIARQMLPLYPGVAALGLAPQGIVKNIVPLAGNEGAIGHDMLNDPVRGKEAVLARDTGRLTLATVRSGSRRAGGGRPPACVPGQRQGQSRLLGIHHCPHPLPQGA